jgi:hypothetical protein
MTSSKRVWTDLNRRILLVICAVGETDPDGLRTAERR